MKLFAPPVGITLKRLVTSKLYRQLGQQQAGKARISSARALGPETQAAYRIGGSRVRLVEMQDGPRPRGNSLRFNFSTSRGLTFNWRQAVSRQSRGARATTILEQSTLFAR